MKYLVLLLFVLIASQSWGQALPPSAGPVVTVEVNRTYSLVRFVQTLAGDNSGHIGSRKVYEKSRFNTPAARRWLRRYRQLDHDPSSPLEGYPEGRIGSQMSTEPFYLGVAASAADLLDLQRRTAGVLPNEVLVSLDSIYRFFVPAFDTLAWQPHAAELGRQREAYAKYLAEKGLMRQFGQLRTFYGSVWPDALPYRILLNPQLDAGKSFTNKGHAMGNLVLLESHPTSRDFAGGSAVVFHEMSHTLSAQQRQALQQRIEGWYLHNPSPNRRHAYHLMEEALATVAGEWMYAQQTGQPETSEWYNDDYINRYAHALYPLMTGYVARGQEVDSAFVAQAISTFDRTFPQAATDYVNLFRYALYWTDADDGHGVWQPFRDQFRSSYTYTVTPILQQESGLKRAQGGDFLPVILVTRQHAATLRYLREQLPALRPHRLRPEQSFLLTTVGPAGPLVLVCIHDPAQLTAAAKLLAEQGHMDPAHPLTLLK
jgi:hypothetical protein